ncbi:MAG: class I tRNA ligase family protein, partial [SAR202 cluster bacterium]|nr:class I tRNA ligase family protein [SAR202 cluster bacterium]
LGDIGPDEEPKATEYIQQMQELVQALLDKGFAYEDSGHVLFHVPSMPEYGRLSGHNREDLIAGARVEVAPYKKDPGDFVLWKPSEDDLPGWDSPWGRGRPGWHIECSAMSSKLLGKSFDIHGGGQDLIFPHHENEIAQSTCAHGPGTYARYWVHNGYLMVEGEKMSKSLGNFYTVHELLDEFPGEAIRLALLKTHYRQPQDFTKTGIEEAKRKLDGFYGALLRAKDIPAPEPTNADIRLKEFKAALCDDLNTPLALLHLHARLSQLNIVLQDESRGGKIAQPD